MHLGEITSQMGIDSKDQLQQSCQCHQDAGNEKICTADQPARSSFWDRIILACKMDGNLYKEVAADKRSIWQAMVIVLLSGIAAGMGKVGIRGPAPVIIEPISAFIGWYMWTYITYLVGTKLLPEAETNATSGELLRAIGFSYAPGIIRIICTLSGIFNIVFMLGSSWMLVAMVVAIKQTLNYNSTLRAVGVCAIGWIIKTLVFMLFFYLVGSPPHPI